MAVSVNTKLFQSIANQGKPESLAKVLKPSKVKKKKATSEGGALIKTLTGDTASKLGPVESSTEMSDILFKIYGLLKKSTESRIKDREKENNFKEEKEYERKRRHKELMDVIKGISPGESATKIVNEENNSIFDTLLSVLGLRGSGKIALTALRLLGRFITGPIGLAIIGAVSAAEIISYLWKNAGSKETQDALAGRTPAGMGMPGQLPSWEQEQLDKAQNKKAKAVDEKGIEKSSLEELEAKRQQLIDTGDTRGYVKKGIATKKEAAKAKLIDDIESEIQKRKSSPESSPSSQLPNETQETPTPTASTKESVTSEGSLPVKSNVDSNIPASQSLSPGESIVPETSNLMGDRLTNVTNENVVSKIMDSSNMNINVVTEQSGATPNMKKISATTMLPPVRNLEPTFQKMIIESTRIV